MAEPIPLHVCLSMFVIDPIRGSEPGNAWNWIHSLAPKVRDLTVITTPESIESIAAATECGAVAALPESVRFVPVPRNGKLRTPLIANWYRIYAAWLDSSAFAVASSGADVAHHVVTGTPFWGTDLARFNGPKVLGPVGVSNTPPTWAQARFSPREIVSENVRGVLARNPTFWRRGFVGTQAADLVLAGEPRAANLADQFGVPWMPESLEGIQHIGPARSDPGFTAVWAGKMASRKAPHLIIEAWQAALPHLPQGSHLDVLGDGDRLSDVRRSVAEHGLGSSVTFFGQVSHSDAQERIARARVLTFTSVRDTSSSQILESLGLGTPVVSIRHSGVQSLDLLYPRATGWSTSARSRASAVHGLAESLVNAFHATDETWQEKSARGIAVAARNT